MKRLVFTTLALTLLSGTSALAQGNALRNAMREHRAAAERSAAAQSTAQSAPAERPQVERAQAERPRVERAQVDRSQAPAPRAEVRTERQPDATPRPRVDRAGGERGNRPDRSQAQSQGGAQVDSRGQAGGQWRGDRNAAQAAAEVRSQRGSQGRARGDGRDWPRPGSADSVIVGQVAERVARGVFSNDRPRQDRDGRPDYRDRDRDGRPDYRDRDGRNYDGRPGWDGRDYGRRPILRPEDRRDRDYNRPRYDERRYPRYVTSRTRYNWRGSIYRPPIGFYHYSWRWGHTLPWNWYTPNYYLNDWWNYGLPMPPAACEWVRVGDDAILVNVFTGRIYQVVHNLFW